MTQRSSILPGGAPCVVVPFDFSAAARNALEVACGHAGDAGRVLVVYVIEPPPRFMPGSFMRLEEDREATLAQSLHALEDALREAGHGDLAHHVRIGDPGEEVAEFAREQSADLIVIPSYGRKGMSRLLIGSVAERVVRLAECPVLVLKVRDPSA